APSVDGEAGAVGEALAIAGIAPETVTYVETHGTATPLGDPIEIAALTQVFRDSTDAKNFCAVGSVKTNVGHLDAAAGAAGLIKTVMAMKHRQLPPSLHYKKPNPKIDFENSPFYVNAELRDWNVEGPLRAGVSSFGIGGTNAHIVLEEAPERDESDASRDWQLVMLSARTETALETMTDNLKTHLQQQSETNLADVAYTLQVGRKAFNHRRVLVVRDAEDAVQALETRDPKRVLSSLNERKKRPVAFLFGGVGDHYVSMAKELYDTEPTFQRHIDECSELLKPHLGLDLRDILYPKTADASAPAKPSGGLDLRKMLRRDGGGDANANKLNQTAIAHPALFVIEYAMTQLLIEWGIRPQAMIGHSLGEYVAACVAGVFSLENALLLVAKRAQMIQALPGGSMLAIPLSEQEIAPMLGEDLYMATVNGPAHCVVSGTTEAVATLEQTLAAKGITSIRVQSSHAFHSPLLAGIVEEFTQLVASCNPQVPSVPYMSNVTGTWMTEDDATDPQYWARHLCQTVRFADGIRELCKEGKYLLLEVGPGQTLSSFATLGRGEGDAERIVLPTIRNNYDQRSDVAFLLNTLGQLWLNGVEVDWEGFYTEEQRYRVPLPTYPFERQRFWIDPPQMGTGDATTSVLALPTQSSKTRRVTDMLYTPVWKKAPQRKSSELAEQQRWLVFTDRTGLGEALVEQLRQQGQEVITVAIGEQFAKSGATSYTLSPQSRADYDALINALQDSEQLPDQIAHLWSLSAEDETFAGEVTFEQVQETGFYSLLYLAQAIGKGIIAEALPLYLVSNHLHELESSDHPLPEKRHCSVPAK
ncbi:MAG: type I polyketide synthase, partial [Tumebacillaceae bacterium]